jgi:hypothetical protein
MFQMKTNRRAHAPAPTGFAASPRAVNDAVLALDSDGTIGQNAVLLERGKTPRSV